MQTNRREFLAGAATVLAGGILVACGGDAVSDSGASGTTGLVNQDWEDLAGMLEAEGVFTVANPGIWAGKEGSHTPAAVVAGSEVTVVTTHGMDPDHWITTLYIRDQNGVVVGLAELDASSPAGEATFVLPAGTTAVTPYAHCNDHGLWRGDVAMS